MIRSLSVCLLVLSASLLSAQCTVDIPSDTVTIYYGYSPLACANVSATATGTAPFSYNWSSGDTSQSIVVCDTASAWYFVDLTDSTACVSTDSIFVKVIDVRCGNNPNNQKVLVCHVPPGNPANEHTICVSENAVPAHLAHGCYLGTCDSDTVMVAPPNNQLLLQVTPNPLADASMLTVTSAQSQQVQLQMMDQTGRVIQTPRTLTVEAGVAGVYQISRAELGTTGSFVMLQVTGEDGSSSAVRLFVSE